MADSGKLGADILHMPRPISKKHRPMPLLNRAAQFAPYAALTGFGDLLEEGARRVEQRRELSEDMAQELDQMIQYLQAHAAEHPLISVTYFCPDAKKPGGAYHTATGAFAGLDMPSRTLFLSGGIAIPAMNIHTVRLLGNGD